MNKVFLACIAAALFCSPLLGQQQTSAPTANAQNPELEQHIRKLEDRVIARAGRRFLGRKSQRTCTAHLVHIHEYPARAIFSRS
jgi:hypothetical protein